MDIHFINVDQGLCILVKSGEDVLIYDGGDRGTSSFVVSYLKKLGITEIDYMISSHYDADHLSGLIGCLNAFDVKNVLASNYVHTSKLYDSFMSSLDAKGIEIQYPKVGDGFTFGTGEFVVIAPSQIDKNDSNVNSVAIKLVNGDNSFIFTGDANAKSEHLMCEKGFNLSCDVLSIGHHGSATSSSSEFLQATLPAYAVLSCGKDNSYGHPDAEVMELLEAMEVELYRNDVQGTIVAHSNGIAITWDKEPCNDYSSGDIFIDDTVTDESILEESEIDESETDEIASEDETLVWISKTGKKYHSVNDCGTMNPDTSRQMTEEEAEELGYEPCKRCH